MSRKILILTRTDVNKNPGPRRMMRWMVEAGHKVEILCTSQALTHGEEAHVTLHSFQPQRPASLPKKLLMAARLLFLRDHGYFIWNRVIREAYERLSERQYDVIICHDIYLTHMATKLAKKTGAKLVIDAREYYPKQNDTSFFWRLLIMPMRIALCARYMPQADLMLTVSDGLADEYVRAFDVPRPIVIESMAQKHAIPLEVRDTDRIRMIYHGAICPERGIDKMIETMDHLDERYSLDIVMVPGPLHGYAGKVRSMAAARRQVNVIEPVVFEEIVPFSATYDVALITYPPCSFNIIHCLPNKFFESIQARLAICVGETPDMAALVKAHDLGVVAQGSLPQDWAQAIQGLDRQTVERYRANADKAAQILHTGAAGEKAKAAIDSLA